MARYLGRDDMISPVQVQRYLRENFVNEDGSEIDDEIATALTSTEEAVTIMKQGANDISYVYYVGDKVAELYNIVDIVLEDDDIYGDGDGEGDESEQNGD